MVPPWSLDGETEAGQWWWLPGCREAELPLTWSLGKLPHGFLFCFRFHGNRDYATVLSISVPDPSSIVVFNLQGPIQPQM